MNFLNVADPLGIKSAIPKDCGLYLLGNTVFNPITNEQFYMVKVGMSANLYDRMKGYMTNNPMVFHIAYKIINCQDYSHLPKYKQTTMKGREVKAVEAQYHQAFEELQFQRFEYAKEWFLVDRQTYLEICEKKFDYFNIGG